MIRVQNNTATRASIPAFLRGLKRETLADLSWTDPALGVQDDALAVILSQRLRKTLLMTYFLVGLVALRLELMSVLQLAHYYLVTILIETNYFLPKLGSTKNTNFA